MVSYLNLVIEDVVDLSDVVYVLLRHLTARHGQVKHLRRCAIKVTHVKILRLQSILSNKTLAAIQ